MIARIEMTRENASMAPNAAVVIVLLVPIDVVPIVSIAVVLSLVVFAYSTVVMLE